MHKPSSLIVTLYDEETNFITVCCIICGAATTVNAVEDDEEEEGMVVRIDHEEGCELALSQVKGRH